MGIEVAFNYPAWVARFTEFANVPEATILSYLPEAQTYHRNDGGGPVEDANTQTVLLNLMVAHIAKINAAATGLVPSPFVGVVNSASEGSVSVGSTPFQGVPGTQQWLLQSQYGAAYWYATLPFRLMRYKVPVQRFYGPIYGDGIPGNWNNWC